MKILIGYDGSQQAKHAVDWSANLAGIKESSVTVISVAPALEAVPPIRDAVDPTSDIPEHHAQIEEAAARLASRGIQAEKLVRAGNPAEQILDAAEEGGFDVVVVGHRGLGAARRFLMGSVSERVVRHASRPVLVVR